ncbi:LysE family translocator [Phaeobacter marinintestinus]|uniref:LysE family translocator n=1 Tax=Falsiphaeobacter marinintestinus TaxID=1492905 RepID=UPI0011B43C9D|nr:LysE family translocator [Phaeobacter marinintestinus]
MTLSPWDLALYAGAVFILFLTPGPVWMALAARSLSGGFRAAWPLALGVVVGDMIWPLLAILGVSWAVGAFDQLAIVLKGVAVVMFVALGVQTLRNAGRKISADSRLTRPGMWAGFVAGVVVILSNPKAILFYMGLLPGFFDLTRLTRWDIAAIVSVSLIVPLIGNLALAGMIAQLRTILSSPAALKRTNQVAGALLILVGLVIPFT